MSRQAPSATAAEVSTDMCLDSHTQSQQLRHEGKLLESRAALASCSAATCPGAIRRDCARWVEEVQSEIPSVAFRATLSGEERGNVQVFLDGELVFDRLEGKALELNPGVYRVRFVPAAPMQPVEQELIVTQGVQLRVVEVELAPPRSSPERAGVEPRVELERPTPIATYVFAGLGTAAAISGVAWTLSTLTGENELEASCAPGCPEKTVDIVRQRALFADVSWGLSAASFVTAAAFYFLRPEVAASDTSIDVALVQGGAVGAVEIQLP